MSNRVSIRSEGGVARVTLSRPDKRNGLDLAMFEALVDAGESLAADPSVRAVILAGEGRAFCAGLDFQWFVANPDEGRRLLERPAHSPANLAQRVAWVWQEVPVPVIAAVHGAAFGGGLQIALGADLRVVAPDARPSVMEIEYGLIPDMSITQTLLRLVPIDCARELIYTGRIVSGAEALELGLATRVADDPVAEAAELAASIAARSPHAVRAAKVLLDRAPGLGRAEALALETELQLGLIGTPNQLEAVASRMAKRAPSFSDPE
jgi:enoyl-CoA hydratase/carnithine racemase